MNLITILSIFLLIQTGNPNLDQDIIYPKAAEEKMQIGETCEVITETDMLESKAILLKYWKKKLSDSTWEKFNRQYMTYNSNGMGTVVYINGACLEKPADFFKKTWCLGMAAEKCYFTAFVDLKRKKVVLFDWNTYGK